MRNSVLSVLSASREPITAREVASLLRATKTDVNAALYTLLAEKVVRKSASPSEAAPLWSVVGATSPAVKPGHSSAPPRQARELAARTGVERAGLYEWQEEALAKWQSKGYRGLLEAVTGSGKTRFAFEAIRRLETFTPGFYTLVVVPTITLMDQWYAEALQFYDQHPNRVGRLGDGYKDDFSTVGRRLVIAVANSASTHVNKLFEFAKNGSVATLLVADEVHRLLYAEQHGRVLAFPFTYTLGMSATLNRHKDVRLGEQFFSFAFEDAKRAGIIPHFSLIQTRIALTPGERSEYERLTEQLHDQLALVKARYARQLEGVDQNILEGQLLRELGRIQRRFPDRDIERLFGCLFRRAAISHTCDGKIRLAQQLGRYFMAQPGRGKRIFFFERVASAEDASAAIEDQGIETSFDRVSQDVRAAATGVWCETLQSGLSSARRREILTGFRSSPAAVLLCCRMLDEGLNVPEIDVAVLVSSSQSKRQRIQRIGRALRKSRYGTRPLIITFHVSETTDANTVQHDELLFGEVATIYKETASTLLQRVQRVLITEGSVRSN